ncbi:hypothetical protein GCM10010191_89710 [Actinomadura vinacea]|uniref:Uncharacterized protein n=1 Tax=Actinomadura vinacea TaxID=115336 RepID=A0ABN3KD64_9ACTN
MRGGAPRVVWFSSESDPRVVSARSVAADLLKEQTPAHLVWNPCSGEIVQLVPMTRAGGLMEGSVGHEGRVCAQVLVVGHARDPFTGTLLNRLDTIMKWLDAWGVTRRWPAGPPLPSPQSYHSRRARRDWARGGHFGASQVPGLHRPDPGGIDIRRVTGPDTPVTALPRQRPIPSQQPARPVPALPLTDATLTDATLADAPDPADAEPTYANGGRLTVLPRTAAPVGPTVASVAYSLGTDSPLDDPVDAPTSHRLSAPLATTAPPPTPTPAPPVPEPASMRS